MSLHHALTDEQWHRIKGLLPGKASAPERSGRDNRLFVDAVLFIAKTGEPWRNLPEHLESSIWRRFDRWNEKQVWECVVRELGDVDLEELQLDSTSIKVHLAAVGDRRLVFEKRCRPPSRGRSLARRPEYQASRGCRFAGPSGENNPDSGSGRRRPASTPTKTARLQLDFEALLIDLFRQLSQQKNAQRF